MNAAVLAAMGNIGVSVVACVVPDAHGKLGPGSMTGLWWPGVASARNTPGDLLTVYDETVGHTGLQLGWSKADAEAMLECLEDMSGPLCRYVLGSTPLFVWGGARRVFHNLAREVPSLIPRIAALAKKTYDPDFQFIRTESIGFPIRADNIMDVMLGEQLVDDIGCPVREESCLLELPRKCLELAAQHKRLIDAIMSEGAVKWTTQSGSVGRREIEGGWRSVGALTRLTYGGKSEPTRRWCDDDSFSLPRLVGWMDGLEKVSQWS